MVGVLAVPAVILGSLSSALSERLLEIPLVAFALAWIAIAYVIWPSAEAGQVATTAAGRRAP